VGGLLVVDARSISSGGEGMDCIKNRKEKKMDKQHVLVFGGSRGIGRAIIKALEHGSFDIQDISRTTGFDLLKDPPLPVSETDIFIYCAGIGSFNENGRSKEEIRKMIRLNLEIPILLTFKVRAKHYIYIGSNSSYSGFAGSEVYCAVKHGILGFARALRKTGKKVSVVSPGTVDTSFWSGSGRERPDLYQEAEDVAAAVVSCIENKADIEELLIMPHAEPKSS
jgi:short-subunit dehydrogenase